MSADKPKRLAVEIEGPARERFVRTREATGCATNAELVRRAVALLERADECQRKGGRVVLELPDGTRETLVLL